MGYDAIHFEIHSVTLHARACINKKQSVRQITSCNSSFILLKLQLKNVADFRFWEQLDEAFTSRFEYELRRDS